MREIILPERLYKLRALNAELRAITPKVRGVSSTPARVWVNADENISEAEIDALLAAAAVHIASVVTPREQNQANLSAAAQSSVGTAFDSLTPNQVRALLAIVLFRAGALNDDGTVRPPAEWV